MNFRKQTHSFLALFLIAVLPGCYSPKIFLSEEEKEFADSLAKAYSADITLQHNYKAVKENRNDGQFWIEIKNPRYENICLKDSSSLKSASLDIAIQCFKIIKYKQNYNTIAILFVKSEFPDKKTESTVCEKHTTVSTNDLRSVQITYWH